MQNLAYSTARRASTVYLGLATAKRCAQNRAVWRRFVSTATSKTSSWKKKSNEVTRKPRQSWPKTV